MTLIPCPACGHSVSPRAVACPRCGDPLVNTTRPDSSVPAPATHSSSPGPSVSERRTDADEKITTTSSENPTKVSNWKEPFKDGKPTATPSGNSMTMALSVLLILAVLGAGGYFMWREQQAKTAKAEQENQQQEINAANLKNAAEDLQAATERLEKLRAARPMEFAIYGSRQFQEAPHGKGMFDTNLIQNGIPQRCVLVVRPSRMANHGLVTTTLNATKITRSQFTMTITAKTGITSQQTDFYDVYEAVEHDDLGRLEVRILELKRQLPSDP